MTDEPTFEELPHPTPRRFGRALLALLVVAGAGAVIVRLAHSPSGDTNAAPTPVPLPVPTAVHVTPALPAPTLTFHRPPDCPRATDGQVACTTYPGLAASTVQALRERFPGIVVAHAVTQMLRPTGPEIRRGLWSREISAHVGALMLRIAVRRADPHDGVTTGMRLEKRLQLIRYFRGPYLVQLELRGPVRSYSLSSTIAWLLTEPRIVRPAVVR
jgi:hypothetical protein